jgi:hypothetical protein
LSRAGAAQRGCGLKGVTPVFAGYGATGDTHAPVIYPMH